MRKKYLTITKEQIKNYIIFLREQERSESTVQKYAHDLNTLAEFLDGRPVAKGLLLEWKEDLVGTYAPASVNTILAAVNRFLTFCGWSELRLRPLKIQKALFLNEEKELTRAEYIRLIRAAERKENERLALVIQTICATGIRVSELRYITVEAVQAGRAEVNNKGKRRTVFLPDKLRRLLKTYLRKQKITAGAVFISRIFPHNLRHLFARTYYAQERDLSRLADILGHANITTTRIYTAESGAVHARQIGRLGLIVT